MIIKTSQELKRVREVASLSLKIQKELVSRVKAGIFPRELDTLASELCKKNKVIPSFFGVGNSNNPYKYSTCISVNDEILHAIPSNIRKIQEGDLVKVDFGIIKDGIYTDHCFTVGVGILSEADKKLLLTGRKAVEEAVKLAIAGNTVGGLGFVMQSIAENEKYSVLRNYTGHGVGNSLWEDPHIPAFGKEGTGQKLEEGMVICIEAQVVGGKNNVYIAKDGWTVKSLDRSKGVMFEYMVVVGEKEPIILTDTRSWECFV